MARLLGGLGMFIDAAIHLILQGLAAILFRE